MLIVTRPAYLHTLIIYNLTSKNYWRSLTLRIQLTSSKKLNSLGKIPVNSILVTVDARSLYTNIPHKKGIKTVETTFKCKNKLTTVINTLLKLIWTLNHFIFDCKNYSQIKGCAIGTNCAPTYANSFMRMFEENYIYRLVQEKCKLYRW